MQSEMRAYSDRLRREGGTPLDMRVGINSGDVVVRSIRKDDLHTAYVPVGHSTNLAARIEQVASPGTVLISEYTRNLVEGYFRLKALGQTTLKGFEKPIALFEVTGVGNLKTRLQVAATRGLTRFVGRKNEIAQLHQALLQAADGHGQVIGIMGEPGLGKSRLLHEFKSSIGGDCLVVEAYGVSFGKNSPYLPVVELLKRFFGFALDDSEHKRRAQIVGQVLALDKTLEDTLPYLFALLGIEDATTALQQMDPQIRRRRTFEALRRLIVCESFNRPLVLIVEDLHWIDSETQGFLDALVESLAVARVLLVTNYRPEYRHGWSVKTSYSQLRLAPLLHQEGDHLLADLLGSHADLDTLKQQILNRTEGTPFYIEEVVQALAEQGVLTGQRGAYRLTAQSTSLQIPATVQGVLAARIDRLPAEEKELLLQLAVIGREFSLALVRRVVNKPDADLERAIATLQSNEFLYQQATASDIGFVFKHALTQEVAYGAVLQEHRKTLHEKVAAATEALYVTNLVAHYPELAHHFARSRNIEKAVEYLILAGEQAARRCANREAVQSFESALEMSARLPDSFARYQAELKIQLILAASFLAIQGLASECAESAYARVSHLSRETGQSTDLFSAISGLSIVKMQQGKLAEMRELVNQMLGAAQDSGDTDELQQAHIAGATSTFFFGDLRASAQHCEQAGHRACRPDRSSGEPCICAVCGHGRA